MKSIIFFMAWSVMILLAACVTFPSGKGQAADKQVPTPKSPQRESQSIPAVQYRASGLFSLAVTDNEVAILKSGGGNRPPSKSGG